VKRLVHEQRLSELLVDFARTLVTDFPIQAILDHLTSRILEVLPVTGAGVMIMGSDTEMHFASASDKVLLQIEGLQIELGEGPCLEAFRTGQRVLIADLAADQRFPRFGPRAVEAGMAAVFSFPMRIEGTQIGAADLYRDKPGALSPEDAAASQVLADVAAAYIMNSRGRVASQEAEEEQRYRALHDPLTGLPNRVLLYDRIAHALARASREPVVPAVLFIDLDRFKVVNDSLGHRAGDRLLVAVTERLQRALRAGDTLARLGGDEFVVLCDDLAEAGQALALAERISNELKAPFQLDEDEVVITASIGMAYAHEGHETPEILLQDADSAMYRAKEQGGARYEVIDEQVRMQAQQGLRRENDLRRAIERDELLLVYQPIVSATDGTLEGVEALLRWQHPRRGLLLPDNFLPLAEETGLIVPIGAWVLTHACQALQRWRHRTGAETLRLSVNMSAVELARPDFVVSVAATLHDTGTDAAQVCLEVTENVLVQEGPEVIRTLDELKELGVGLAIDDFGTGYCSLTYLKRVPADTVKVDRTFVAGLGSDQQDTAIVTAVVRLAHSLGMAVVAEGVETPTQLERIRELGCDLVQGYHLFRPLEGADFAALVNS
jgi:diguanylate cyclase (GGDEF)-like protein